MHRHLALVALLLSLAACKIEPTPQGYLSQQDPAEVERAEAADEIRARLGAFGLAMANGDRAAAVQVLVPTALTEVFGVRGHGGVAGLGPEGLAEALGEIDYRAPVVARMPDLRVEPSLRQGMVWFASHLVLFPTVGSGEPQRVRITGVFVREEGQWHLAQIHLSEPVTEPPADSAAASPRKAAAPAGGG